MCSTVQVGNAPGASRGRSVEGQVQLSGASPVAVEERCRAIAEAAQEIVEAFMQDFQIRLKTGIPKQVRARGARRSARASGAQKRARAVPK